MFNSWHRLLIVPGRSPFYCDLLFRDKSLRPPVDSTVGKGRSWDAALQLGVAKQIIEDAAHDKAVTGRLLMSAIHRLEYDMTFRRTPGSEDIGKEVAMLDGVWSLVSTTVILHFCCKEA